MIYAAAVVVLVAALAAAFLANRSNSTVESVDEPTETPARFNAESAQAIVDDYFAAHNAGDVDATFGLFTDTARFGDAYTDERGSRFDAVDTPEDYELVGRIYEALHPKDPEFGFEAVEALLTERPAWLAINAGVVQRPLIASPDAL